MQEVIMRNVSKLVLSVLFGLVMSVSACDKKSDGGGAQPESKPEPKLVPAETAKASKETCEKVAQHQIDIETDAQMKSALKQSMQGLIDQCMQTNQAQAACMLSAKDGPGFADCVMKNR
jgi:hypothetical protein